jgi:hypothetical protein
MRKYCDYENTGLQIFMDLHVFSFPNYKKEVLGRVNHILPFDMTQTA